MMKHYDHIANELSQSITKTYSTSFSHAVRMLHSSIRQDIFNIYGYVRLADEIVDTFHNHDKERMLDDLEKETWTAMDEGLSINPVVHSFQLTCNRYAIDKELIRAFLASMRMDLDVKDYSSQADIDRYIYGSADVVGLMCLHVFVKGDKQRFEELKDSAMRLGSAFQKVNFLRDICDDQEVLGRNYFPQLKSNDLTPEIKKQIIEEIENDFKEAYTGVQALPLESRFGVYTAYRYYKALLKKLDSTPAERILTARIRVKNHIKFGLLARSYVRYKLNLLN